MIKDEIIKDCRKQIDDGMKGLRTSIQTLLIDQNNILQGTNQVNNSNAYGTPSQHPTPVLSYQQNLRNQPSPNHRAPPPRTNTRHSNPSSSSFVATYQRSGSMLFQYQGSEYELRDQQYNKKSSELQEVSVR